MKTILQTPRLLLRQFTVTDAPLILSLNSDPQVLKYLHEPALESVEQAQKIITDIILPQYKNKLGRWAIQLLSDGSFIGWCGLKYRPFLDEIDLGYRLMQPAWGNGYATEAASFVMEYGFKQLGISQVTGRAHIQNLASIHILEKLGMQFIKEEIVDDCPVKTFIKQNPAG